MKKKRICKNQCCINEEKIYLEKNSNTLNHENRCEDSI